MPLIRTGIILLLLAGFASPGEPAMPAHELILKKLAEATERNQRLEAENQDLKKWLALKPEDNNNLREDVIVKSQDGDTVTLKEAGLCRILGINTPETWQKEENGQWKRITNPDPRGLQAYEFLRSLEGRSVRVSIDVEERDKYGRTLLHLYLLPSGPDLASHILRQGWARPVAIKPNLGRYKDHRADAALGREQNAGPVTSDTDISEGGRKDS